MKQDLDHDSNFYPSKQATIALSSTSLGKDFVKNNLGPVMAAIKVSIFSG